MSTSGSYDNATNMSNIIKDAFSLINVIDDGEPIPANMWEYGKRKLNELMSLLSAHRGMWLEDTVDVTLTPGTTSYTMGVGETIDTPKPMRIVHARRVTASGTHIPLAIISQEEYLSLPNKEVQSPATCIWYDRRRDSGELYVWGTGTATEDTLELTTQRPIQDFDSEGNSPDFPKEAVLPVTYQLAAIIAPKYKGGVIPPDVGSMARELMGTFLDFDSEEVPIKVQP